MHTTQDEQRRLAPLGSLEGIKEAIEGQDDSVSAAGMGSKRWEARR